MSIAMVGNTPVEILRLSLECCIDLWKETQYNLKHKK